MESSLFFFAPKFTFNLCDAQRCWVSSLSSRILHECMHNAKQRIFANIGVDRSVGPIPDPEDDVRARFLIAACKQLTKDEEIINSLRAPHLRRYISTACQAQIGPSDRLFQIVWLPVCVLEYTFWRCHWFIITC